MAASGQEGWIGPPSARDHPEVTEKTGALELSAIDVITGQGTGPEQDLTKVNTPAQACHGGGEGGRIETKSQDQAVSK